MDSNYNCHCWRLHEWPGRERWGSGPSRHRTGMAVGLARRGKSSESRHCGYPGIGQEPGPCSRVLTPQLPAAPTWPRLLEEGSWEKWHRCTMNWGYVRSHTFPVHVADDERGHVSVLDTRRARVSSKHVSPGDLMRSDTRTQLRRMQYDLRGYFLITWSYTESSRGITGLLVYGLSIWWGCHWSKQNWQYLRGGQSAVTV